MILFGPSHVLWNYAVTDDVIVISLWRHRDVIIIWIFYKTDFKSDMIGFRTTMEDADCCEPSLPAPLEG